MPSYKNSFQSPDIIEETILGDDGKKLGTIRIKPSSVQWKPTGKQSYQTVSLDAFTDWIMDPNTKAKKTKS
ncbi:hypothetical protein QMA69_26515 [Burkholderia pseudomallei]|uniref:hypothetical protein n=1 Tax=Burkholderia pseudomallei TaxID=28450 RepID=UPI002DB5683F|nr:hypothetical protein [Burkholderia pseudomallei]MEB5487983.1 hypothetical protein [Burkholderia pseudomallei]MEB5494566.1 hypothetical protein [Burkholderia pseudomallei]MEB5501070.1 hypothetical protein [Burkholderia pseudomallei]MEB5506863.1 hypothetical protein [Burkholderia pseudomallei]MEB5513990.1 hypothetical protein [Burkholderia pseudomallei]